MLKSASEHHYFRPSQRTEIENTCMCIYTYRYTHIYVYFYMFVSCLPSITIKKCEFTLIPLISIQQDAIYCRLFPFCTQSPLLQGVPLSSIYLLLRPTCIQIISLPHWPNIPSSGLNITNQVAHWMCQGEYFSLFHCYCKRNPLL